MFTACPKSWLQDFWKDVCVCMGVCMYVYKYVCVCVCVYISPVVRNGLIGSWYPETNRSYFLKESLFSLFDSVLPVGNSELTKTPFSNPCSQYVLAILSTSFFFGMISLRISLTFITFFGKLKISPNWIPWDLFLLTAASPLSLHCHLRSSIQFLWTPWYVPLQIRTSFITGSIPATSSLFCFSPLASNSPFNCRSHTLHWGFLRNLWTQLPEDEKEKG